jgi:hypothetical protein
MTDICETPNGTWSSIYRERGFWPRPAFNGVDTKTGERFGKACKEKSWSKPDSELPQEKIKKWDHEHPTDNMGLLMGSPIGDGTFLGAFDIDDDNYVRLGHLLLGDPVCGRVGMQ